MEEKSAKPCLQGTMEAVTRFPQRSSFQGGLIHTKGKPKRMTRPKYSTKNTDIQGVWYWLPEFAGQW